MVAKIFILLTALFPVAQGNTSSPQDVEKISGEVEIRRYVSDWRGNSSIPEVKSGGQYELTLKIRNSDKEDFTFARASSGCSCSSFELVPQMIAAGVSIDAVFKFKVPESLGKESLYHVGGYFHSDKGESLGVFSVAAKVSGNLHCEFSQSNRLKSKEISEILMPITYSAPIEYADLEVVGEDTFEGIDVLPSIVQIDGQAFLRVTVHNLMRDGSSISGRLTIRDKVSQKAYDVPMLLIEESPIQVAPLIIKFRKSKQPSDTSVNASCMLKFNHLPESDDEDDNEAHEPSVLATASFNGRPLNVDIKRLSRSVFRLQISASPAVLDSELSDEKIVWEIKRGADIYRYENIINFD